jgi:hypothetical protein
LYPITRRPMSRAKKFSTPSETPQYQHITRRADLQSMHNSYKHKTSKSLMHQPLPSPFGYLDWHSSHEGEHDDVGQSLFIYGPQNFVNPPPTTPALQTLYRPTTQPFGSIDNGGSGGNVWSMNNASKVHGHRERRPTPALELVP